VASQNARKHGLTGNGGSAQSLHALEKVIREHFGAGPVDVLALRQLAEAEALLSRIRAVEDALGKELDASFNADGEELPAESLITSTDTDAPKRRSYDAILDDLRPVFRYRAEAEAKRHKACRQIRGAIDRERAPEAEEEETHHGP